jgi:aryl-alcohol dehydrogenase-like predicted oxidoreductase
MNAARASERNLAIAEEVKRTANEVGMSSPQVALAWLRQKGPNILPILGARTARQLIDNLDCLGLTLSLSQMEKLDRASAVDLGFPMDFLSAPFVRGLVHGETWEQIDKRR